MNPSPRGAGIIPPGLCLLAALLQLSAGGGHAHRGHTAGFAAPPALAARGQRAAVCPPASLPRSHAPRKGLPLSDLRAVEGFDEWGSAPPRKQGNEEAMYPIPLIVGPIGGGPLLPGSIQPLNMPVGGQLKAIDIALTFASLEKTYAGRPLIAFIAQSPDTATNAIRGAATLATLEDVQSDGDGVIESAVLAGVGRAFVHRVHVVNGSLIVANTWDRVHDEIPPSSYMHSLEALRELADEASFEHNKRRELMSQITLKASELQLCDLEGVCNTEALYELGPEVHSKAMELSASASAAKARGEGAHGEQLSVAHVLSSLEDLTAKSLRRSQPWDELWPQWGDEIDGELRYLKAFSFSAWRALKGVCGVGEYYRALGSTDTVARLREAKDRLYQHRLQLEEALVVLGRIEQRVKELSTD